MGYGNAILEFRIEWCFDIFERTDVCCKKPQIECAHRASGVWDHGDVTGSAQNMGAVWFGLAVLCAISVWAITTCEVQETFIERGNKLMARGPQVSAGEGRGVGDGGGHAALGKQRPCRSSETRRAEPADVCFYSSLCGIPTKTTRTCGGVNTDDSTARACNLRERFDATVYGKSYTLAAVTKYLVLHSSGSGSIWRVEALR